MGRCARVVERWSPEGFWCPRTFFKNSDGYELQARQKRQVCGNSGTAKVRGLNASIRSIFSYDEMKGEAADMLPEESRSVRNWRAGEVNGEVAQNDYFGGLEGTENIRDCGYEEAFGAGREETFCVMNENMYAYKKRKELGGHNAAN